MTPAFCFMAWAWAVLSEDNRSTGVTILCFLAWTSSLFL